MTPEQMHAAAVKLREHAGEIRRTLADHPSAARFVPEYEVSTLAARMLDRLAADPERDPVEAYFAPPQRQTLTVRCTPHEDGTITGEIVDVRPTETPKE